MRPDRPIAAALTAILIASAAAAEPLAWPTYGPETDALRIDDARGGRDAFVNAVPDIVGPVDGSARLTILTEGNHYPVLLPLLFERFPAWCAETGRCDIAPDDILAITLPQVMIVDGLTAGGLRFGNARLPLRRDGAVFPDLLMLGANAMARVDRLGLIDGPARIFARHRGLGLLVDRRAARKIASLDDFAAASLPFVMATPNEAGARRQYRATLAALLGETDAKRVAAREIADFPGRVAIQHRDIPYAVMNGIAPAGILFTHLAAFYADRWPDRLRHVEVPDAAAYGQEIAVAATTRPGSDAALRNAFLDFLFQVAPAAYPAGGFAVPDAFAFGEPVPASDTP